MSNAVTSRLAAAALRGVLAEVESAPELAAEALSRLLGVGAPASAPRSPEGRHGAAEPDEGERLEGAPASRARPRPSRKAQRPRPAKVARKGKPVGADDGAEAVELAGRLVEAHGGVNAAARAVGSSPALFRRWRKGAPIKPASLKRLRAAVAALDAGDGEGQERVSSAAIAADETPATEAAGLLAQLVERHGSVELVSDRLGLTLSALERVASGAAVGQTTTQRLRAGLANPTPEEAQAKGEPEVRRASTFRHPVEA